MIAAIPVALTPGTRIGAYEVIARIGVGGMGEVYRARDTRLGREVALKVLPDAFVSDPERVARFQREAKALASLNHPNIGGIHGLEQADGITALVLELVEGKTLTELLAPGRSAIGSRTPEGLPMADVHANARQIADALEAAHERGIVHRDLKPDNVKITLAGVVKVLDFGLAKAASADPDLTPSPAMTMGGTREGVILGTPAYMSPEQARGKPVDKRTDPWAFGCVLYEMLTGRPAFAGDTISDTIARILERDPDWRALPAATPPNVTRLLQRCLDKDPKRRVHDIADARIEIEDALGGASVTPAEPAFVDRRAVRLPWAVAGATGNVMDLYETISWEMGFAEERSRAALDRQIKTEVSRLCTDARIRPVLIVGVS